MCCGMAPPSPRVCGTSVSTLTHGSVSSLPKNRAMLVSGVLDLLLVLLIVGVGFGYWRWWC